MKAVKGSGNVSRNSPRGDFAISVVIVLSILMGIFSGAAMPAEAAPAPGTRTPYELNIEVDYYEGLLWPEVILAFDFLKDYFESRGIKTEVDFNSTNNVIEGDGYLGTPTFGGSYIGSLDAWRSVNLRYHDNQDTHIHFIVAQHMGNYAGRANPNYGAGISLDDLGRDYGNIRFAVMHKIGNCIGIGAQDFEDSPDGFMAPYDPDIAVNTEEYRAEDWDSAFAPDGSFGDSAWCSARIWNRFSVMGELYDPTSDVMGRASGTIRTSIRLRDMGGTIDYAIPISPIDGEFSFKALEPGTYTLDLSEGYRWDGPTFLNVTEREIIQLGNATIDLARSQPPEPLPDNRPAQLLAAITVSAILVLAFAMWVRRKGYEGKQARRKIMAVTVIAVALLLVLTSFYWSQNYIHSPVTALELFDDIVDSNGDGVIDSEDVPFTWHSYGAGDRVVVRDRIEYIWFDPCNHNKTSMTLVYNNSGKYGGWGRPLIQIVVPGDLTDTYSVGDWITVKNRMVEYAGHIYPESSGWTLVG